MTASRRRRLVAAARAVLFVGGLALVAWLVASAGTERVVETIGGAGNWIAPIMILEIAIVAADPLSVRVLAGDPAREVPPRTWVRSTALANATAVLLPAGRAAGEAMRAAALAPVLGAGRATGACARAQGCALVANALVSFGLACALASDSSTHALALALLGNAALCVTGAAVVFRIARSARVSNWLAARFGAGEIREDPGRRRRALAVLVCLAARAVQAVQYGIVLHAVGGVATVRAAFVAQGIQLVGASAGDVVPNQVGTREGAYRMFAGALHLEGAIERALSIALVVRIAQLALAAVSFAVAAALHRPDAAGEREP